MGRICIRLQSAQCWLWRRGDIQRGAKIIRAYRRGERHGMSGNQILPHRSMGCRPSWVSRLGMCRRCHRGHAGPREGIGDRIIVVRGRRWRHGEQYRGIDCRGAAARKPPLRSVQAQIPTLGPEFGLREALHPAGRRPAHAHAPHQLPSTRREYRLGHRRLPSAFGMLECARSAGQRRPPGNGPELWLFVGDVNPHRSGVPRSRDGPPGFGRSPHARCRIALESGL